MSACRLLAAVFLAAQLYQPSLSQEPAATAPQLPVIGSQVQRSLQQVDALLADELWDEAIDILESLLADSSGKLVEASPGRFISLEDNCHNQIAHLPVEAVRLYRERVDPSARELYERGRRNRDQAALEQVAREYFCSSWGDDALLLLGEIALERGETIAAKRYWRQINPTLSDPTGRPLAWALRDIDLDEHASTIAEKLSVVEAPPGALVYPDSDLPVAGLLSRLAVASVYEGDMSAVEQLTKLLHALSPEAEGRLAGREGRWFGLLQSLLVSARDWPGDDATRPIGPLYGRLWPRPFTLTPTAQAPVFVLDQFGRRRIVANQPPQDLNLHCLPTIAGSAVVIRDAAKLRAFDLLTSEPTINRRGVLHELAQNNRRKQQNRRPGAAIVLGGALVQQRIVRSGNSLANPPTDERLAMQRGMLYARVPAEPDPEFPNRFQVMAFDLRREGLEAPIVEPPNAPWRIAGPPLLDGHRLYLPLIADDVRTRFTIACYSASTGREIWRTETVTGAASAQPGFALSSDTPRGQLTLAEDTLYFNSNLGAVVALAKPTGHIRWARLYDRKNSPVPNGVQQPNSAAAPPLVHRGRLFVAPTDANTIFALDAATGRPLWVTENVPWQRQLLGAADGALVIGGDQLLALDINDGQFRYRWPESRKAGIRGKGRGCLVGGEVFWPTRNLLYVFEAKNGAPSRPPIHIADLGGGANVVPAHGLLVVAGPKAMTVLGPINQQQDEAATKLSAANIQRFPIDLSNKDGFHRSR